MPPLTPWLQRLLIAWAASTVSTGVILTSAQNRFRPKKAKKRRRRELTEDGDDAGPPAVKRTPPAILPGTVAKADAAEPFTPSLTWAGWATDVRARGRRLLRFVTGQAPEGSVDADGSRLPDEIVTADGKKVRLKATKPGTVKKKKKGAAPPVRRRRGQQKQASLFDSAKESLRQVVKEEAKKAVDEKVEQAGLKKAADAIKSAGEKVGETAKDVAQRVKDSMPDDVDEKIQSAGRSIFAEAKRAMQRLSDSLQGDDVGQGSFGPGDRSNRGTLPGDSGATPPTDGLIIDVGANAIDASSTADAASAAQHGTAQHGDGQHAADHAGDQASDHAGDHTGLTTTSAPGEHAPDAGIEGVDLVSALGDGVQKLGGGVQKLGSFLSGPGNPGYHRSSGRRAASGDVVDAKDPVTPPPAPPPTPPTE